PPSSGPRPKKASKKKIAIDLPSVPKDPGEDGDAGETRPAKRQRMGAKGVGSSALFSMLPAPKVENPALVAPSRVLGGGTRPGLVFNASSAPSFSAPTEDQEEVLPEPGPSSRPVLPLLFPPPSLAKGRANISLEEGGVHPPKPVAKPPSSSLAVDFFSLGAWADGSSSSASASRSSSLSKISAPKVDDFVPPEPTLTDPYPGYYQLPSGAWAQYDPEYYRKFYTKWKADYDKQIRSLEKGVEKGFEGAQGDETREINAQKEMERAKREVQELEERKMLTTGGDRVPEGPRMNIQGAKLGKGARTRHQLTTLLADAYANREALEAKIAEGKRNRKEAGNKYGACTR
ncbi:mitotic checkpoint regulator, MAD2B-interacting-domain-containing protein, partial [Vararia minispora EC-137]